MMNFNPHVHSVVPEGVFLQTGEFVGLPDAPMHRAEELWRERVFALLLDEHKIDEATAGSMRTWPHSGFSVDFSVRIEAHDQAAMSRLVGYISHCPISLARMITRPLRARLCTGPRMPGAGHSLSPVNRPL
ncbi:transposase [Chitinispirillales bacterium ANBcel5]|uniref:transposase n=1 Tax=Cellulosispirillum alkaliphilum TaxID=3039283 RepID=UPI002A55A39E|nr:transposase [Chitinispirillales bacterium ANBcel5]